MSVRTYNLRARADAGVANQSRAENNPNTLLRNPMPFAREIPPHLEATRETGEPAPLYSDVVASRPPSPQQDVASVTVARSAREPNEERVFTTPSSQLRPVTARGHLRNEKIEHYASSEESDLPQNQGDTQWTTVKRRRARSLGSLGRVS